MRNPKAKNIHDHIGYYKDDDFSPSSKPEPTHHPAGSFGKIQVMRMRIEKGQELFHEADSTLIEPSKWGANFMGLVAKEGA